MLSNRTINYRSVGLFKLQIMRPTKPHLWTDPGTSDPFGRQFNVKYDRPGNRINYRETKKRTQEEKVPHAVLSIVNGIKHFSFISSFIFFFFQIFHPSSSIFFLFLFSSFCLNGRTWSRRHETSWIVARFLEIGIILSTTWKLCQ